jgi:UDP-N-acetylmuramoylalanine-D-glutamate ligase
MDAIAIINVTCTTIIGAIVALLFRRAEKRADDFNKARELKEKAHETTLQEQNMLLLEGIAVSGKVALTAATAVKYGVKNGEIDEVVKEYREYEGKYQCYLRSQNAKINS